MLSARKVTLPSTWAAMTPPGCELRGADDRKSSVPSALHGIPSTAAAAPSAQLRNQSTLKLPGGRLGTWARSAAAVPVTGIKGADGSRVADVQLALIPNGSLCISSAISVVAFHAN